MHNFLHYEIPWCTSWVPSWSAIVGQPFFGCKPFHHLNFYWSRAVLWGNWHNKPCLLLVFCWFYYLLVWTRRILCIYDILIKGRCCGSTQFQVCQTIKMKDLIMRLDCYCIAVMFPDRSDILKCSQSFYFHIKIAFHSSEFVGQEGCFGCFVELVLG